MDNSILNSGMSSLEKRFDNPGALYRGKPFWSWNGELSSDELIRQTDVMKEMGLGGYFMHSRSGLITEYLGDEWFDCIRKVSDHSKEIGMEAWLYDEDRWPSGSAGGIATQNPEFRMKSILVEEKDPEEFIYDDTVYSAFAVKVEDLNLSDYYLLQKDIKDEEKKQIKEKGYIILKLSVKTDSPNSVYNGTTYLDTMKKDAVAEFMRITHERYKKECGEEFGKTIKGIFTDEPHRGEMLSAYSKDSRGYRTCKIAWTDDFFDEFRKRYGYDPEPIFPELVYRKNGEMISPIKHDYIDLSDSLFIERFAAPINKWCEDNGIEFTGHILHEDQLITQTIPSGSVMRFYEQMGVPGIDLLGENNSVIWISKLLDSAAHQTGKKWRLSELYGCTGWQMKLDSHKHIGSWQAFYGVNLRCPHLSWYNMEGEAKRDYPASILHQAPWWKDYKKIEDFFARYGVIMTEGEPCTDVLVINPVETVWSMAYIGWSNWIFSNSPDIDKIEEQYERLFKTLSALLIDFDYGDEEMMSRLASVEIKNGEPVITVGEASYRQIVVSGLLTVRSTTLDLIEKFADAGGRVLFIGEEPKYIDARPAEKPVISRSNMKKIPFEKDVIRENIVGNIRFLPEIFDNGGNCPENVFCRVREAKEDGCIFAVVLNYDKKTRYDKITLKINGIISSRFESESLSVEKWNLSTGERRNIDEMWDTGDNYITIKDSLYANDTNVYVIKKAEKAAKSNVMEIDSDYLQDRMTAAFCISKPINGDNIFGTAKPRPACASAQKTAVISLTDSEYYLEDKNICVLDFASWRFPDKSAEWSSTDEILRVDGKVRDAAGIPHRSGNMLQPWYVKKYCNKTFGTLEWKFDFYVDTLPDKDLTLCGERPEKINYYVNGKQVLAENPGEFWIDICFKKMRVPKEYLSIGKNTVTCVSEFSTLTNLEALYLTGDFGVEIKENKDGIKNEPHIITLPKTISAGKTEDFAMPFYSGALTYVIPNQKIKDIIGERINVGGSVKLSVPVFEGALVRVAAQSRPENTRLIISDPFEADITDWVIRGENILLSVVCSRRSTFGPLHLNPPLRGGYGPDEFLADYAPQYVFLPNGLPEDIKIIY